MLRLSSAIAFALMLACAIAVSGSERGATPAPALSANDSSAAAAAAPDYIAQIRRDFTPENREYANLRATLGWVRPLALLGIAMILLFSRASARMRDFAHRRSRRRYPRAFIYVGLVTLAATLLSLPLDCYQGFVLEHRFALSNQSLAQWLEEQGTDALVNFAILGASGLAGLAYRAIENSPTRWWLRLGVAAFPVILAGTLLEPLVVDPLYNQFTPLKDKALEAKIVALAARAGIPGRRVFEVDRSRQTRKFNAYVNGFGASQRIVLWDTTIKGMREDEILFVLGHEMGHYRLNHLWKGIALSSLAAPLVLFLTYRLSRFWLGRFGSRWGLSGLDDIASLPLLLSSLLLITTLGQPIDCAVSRRMEHEADAFALEITHANDAGARTFIKFGSQNRSDPEPSRALEVFEYTHPPLIERVRFALDYRPWEMGQPNRYFTPAR